MKNTRMYAGYRYSSQVFSQGLPTDNQLSSKDLSPLLREQLHSAFKLVATITYRTTDDKKEKLAALAKDQHISINKVIDELVTIAVTERDAYSRFQIRAARGNAKAALDILHSKGVD